MHGITHSRVKPVNTVMNKTYNPFDDEKMNFCDNEGSGKEIPPSRTTMNELSPPAIIETAASYTKSELKPSDEHSISGKYGIENKKSIFTVEANQQELERQYDDLDGHDRTKIIPHEQPKENNWPSCPRWSRIKPCFYHNITADIPPEYQTVVRVLYYLWVSYSILLSLNLLVGVMSLILDVGHSRIEANKFASLLPTNLTVEVEQFCS